MDSGGIEFTYRPEIKTTQYIKDCICDQQVDSSHY